LSAQARFIFQLRAHAGDSGAYLARRGAAHVVARGDGAFQGQYLEYVFTGQRGKRAQLLQRQVGQVATGIDAGAHGQGHRFMGIAERQALL